MAVSCGDRFTLAVTEDGGLWGWGDDRCYALGRGPVAANMESMHSQIHTPQRVRPERTQCAIPKGVVAVSAGSMHSACVTEAGEVWMWGNGHLGEIGQGAPQSHNSPKCIPRAEHGDVDVVMVSCASSHTLVLTVDGSAWSCGSSPHGALGHNTPAGDRTCAGRLARVQTAAAGGTGTVQAAPRFAMLAAGFRHSVAVDRHGAVWCWGHHVASGQPGADDVLVATRVPCVAGLAEVLFVAAGSEYSLAVTGGGALWAWGENTHGELGLGHTRASRLPAQVLAPADFCAAPVVMAACGGGQSLAVTRDGVLWAWGQAFSRRVASSSAPVRVRVPRHTSFVAAAVGDAHLAAVSEDGVLFTWGGNKDLKRVNAALANGLGCEPVVATVFPRRVELMRRRVGRCQRPMAPVFALALAMGTHPRLGDADSTLFTMSTDLLCQIVTATAVWPQCAATSLPGPARLLGGGFMSQCPAHVF